MEELAEKLIAEGRVSIDDCTRIADRDRVRSTLNEMAERGWAEKSQAEQGVYHEGELLQVMFEDESGGGL